MLYEFSEMVEWARTNELVFKIVREEDFIVVHAELGRISADYQFDPNSTSEFGGAAWAAMCAVRAGSEFHAIHGFTPGLSIKESDGRI